MEQVLNTQNVIQGEEQQEKPEVCELDEQQWRLIGGGCAEVCPY